LGNSRAPSHTKNDAIPANGVTAFGVVCNFSSSEPKSGLKLNVSFCAAPSDLNSRNFQTALR
jgi:hypothetical protein